MNGVIVGLDAAIGVLRVALLAAGVVVAALAGASYLVRTRRLNPFSAASRFVRGSVDPLFAPMERRVVRSGGAPATAGWWTLAVVVVGGIVLINVLGFAREQIALAAMATTMGSSALASLLLSWTFGVLRIALFVRVLASWVRLGAYSPWVRWAFRLTDWLVRPLQRIIPPIGMIDVSPIAAYVVLMLLEPFLRSILQYR